MYICVLIYNKQRSKVEWMRVAVHKFNCNLNARSQLVYTHIRIHINSYIHCEVQSTTELRLEQRTEWDFESSTLAPLFHFFSSLSMPFSFSSLLRLLRLKASPSSNNWQTLVTFYSLPGLKEGSIFLNRIKQWKLLLQFNCNCTLDLVKNECRRSPSHWP